MSVSTQAATTEFRELTGAPSADFRRVGVLLLVRILNVGSKPSAVFGGSDCFRCGAVRVLKANHARTLGGSDRSRFGVVQITTVEVQDLIRFYLQEIL